MTSASQKHRKKFLKFCSFYPQVFWHTTRARRHLCIRFVLKSCSAQSSLPWLFHPLSADTFPSSGPVVSGKRASLHKGEAAAPKKAPASVKRAIWAANQLRSKPYRYGGGHRSFYDVGYDCSGTVSYALGAAGLIGSPMSSTEFRKYGRRGRGKWITVYARKGHTFAVIAGLRLDTTPYDNYTGRWAPGWQTTDRPPRGFVARHPVGL